MHFPSSSSSFFFYQETTENEKKNPFFFHYVINVLYATSKSSSRCGDVPFDSSNLFLFFS